MVLHYGNYRLAVTFLIDLFRWLVVSHTSKHKYFWQLIHSIKPRKDQGTRVETHCQSMPTIMPDESPTSHP